MKVKATKLFKQRNVFPCELGHIPNENEEFEISNERYNLLSKHPLGCFVVKVETEIEKAVVSKAKKKK